MLIAMIHSQQTAEGCFEQKVEGELSDITMSGDPREYIKYIIAEHLAVCVESTKIPLGVGFWNVEFNPQICKTFGLPVGFTS